MYFIKLFKECIITKEERNLYLIKNIIHQLNDLISVQQELNDAEQHHQAACQFLAELQAQQNSTAEKLEKLRGLVAETQSRLLRVTAPQNISFSVSIFLLINS